MACIGMEKKNGKYYVLSKFSRDDSLNISYPFHTFEAGLAKLLRDCVHEVTSGALRESLTGARNYKGLTEDQRIVIGNVINLYNQVVGYFPKK